MPGWSAPALLIGCLVDSFAPYLPHDLLLADTILPSHSSQSKLEFLDPKTPAASF
jgi:hypothetical protein